MSQHPNVTTVNRMTHAIFGRARTPSPSSSPKTSSSICAARTSGQAITPAWPGLVDVLGSVFEATNGDVRLEQKFCVGVDGWAAEWEHATLGRNGKTLESDNAFMYRFDGDRIAEMWMFLGVARTGRFLLRLKRSARRHWCYWTGRGRCPPGPCTARVGRAYGLPTEQAASRRPSVDELDSFATVAYLTGREGEAFDRWTEAHAACLDASDFPRAARLGIQLAQAFGFKGYIGRSSGWVARARQVLDQAPDCVEHGYLEYAAGMCRIFEVGDLPGARELFARAAKVAERFGDRELRALANLASAVA